MATRSGQDFHDVAHQILSMQSSLDELHDEIDTMDFGQLKALDGWQEEEEAIKQ